MDEKLDKLLSALGFKEKFGIKYFSLETFSSISSLSPLSRIISRINENNQNAQIHGTYVIESNAGDKEGEFSQIDNKYSIFHPVVFVAKADSVQEAREIHLNLWNSSSAPFIIVQLPDQIRVYTGFDYDRNNEKHGLLDEIHLERIGLFDDFVLITNEALQKYSAESIDDGSIWQKLRNAPQEQFNYDNRVDKRLLKNLEDLESELLRKLSYLELDNTLKYVHAIIGKYVYLRYLYDRRILTETWAGKKGVDLNKVLKRGANLSELIKLTDVIEERFGGEIFPFPEGFKKVFDDDLIDYVASVFCGDTAYGQAVLFDIYDFSYIPTETLSYIYEQFLKAQGLSKKHGAVYTPEALADYLVNEINTIKPLKRGMKILDPCCGSGIFLVLTYRYLIELELQGRQDKNLKPNELKQIMEESIHGIETNLEACYVTEFSLILILLNYLEPPDLDKYGRFKFPHLHGKNIFEGDFFQPNREYFPESEDIPKVFDWVIGNPPWKTINVKKNPDDKNALSWVERNSKKFPVGDRRIEEAFAWQATEFVTEQGCIGFVLPAKRLFNMKSERFRKEFFRKNEVRRITNFSNFHYLLFQADVSAITIIYQKAKQNKAKQPIWHYSPFAANQPIAQLKKGKPTRPVWAIIINKSEIRMIEPEEAEKGKAITWKIAFWGNYEEEVTLKRIFNSYSKTLQQLCNQRKWHISEGLVLKDKNKAKDRIESLDTIFEDENEESVVLNMNKLGKCGFKYHIPNFLLEVVSENKRYYRFRAGTTGINLIKAPHLVVNTEYSIYSDKNFIIPGGQTGISASEKDSNYLKAVSIYLGSNIGRFLLFFESTSWGIDRRTISPESVKSIPFPDLSEEQINKLAQLQLELAQREENNEPSEVLSDLLNSTLEKVLNLPENIGILVSDFLRVKLTLDKGKTVDNKNEKVRAVKKPTEDDLRKYTKRLRSELDEFTEGSDEKHIVTIVYSDDLIVCQVNLLDTSETQEYSIQKATGRWRDILSSIKKSIEERFSQWIYIQRELRFFDTTGNTFYVCKSARLIDWTESQAISDAADLFGETLTKTDLNLNSIAVTANYGNNIASRTEKN